MSITDAFLSGILLSFGLILPLGVQNVFIFNQGVSQKKFSHALPSVLAASLCDTLLIILAISGISLVVMKVIMLKKILFGFGFVFLFYLSWVNWNAKFPSNFDHIRSLSAKRQIVFSITVSLLNPHAILDTVSVIGTTSLAYAGYSKLAYSFGCVIVSFFWFFGLSFVGNRLRQVDQLGSIPTIINRLSALLIASVACYLGVQFFTNE